MNATLRSHKAKCVIPQDLLAAIVEGHVCVCPDQRIKKDVDEWLYYITGATAVPCFVEVLVTQKSESKSGKGSNGKETKGPSSPVRDQPPADESDEFGWMQRTMSENPTRGVTVAANGCIIVNDVRVARPREPPPDEVRCRCSNLKGGRCPNRIWTQSPTVDRCFRHEMLDTIEIAALEPAVLVKNRKQRNSKGGRQTL